MRILVTGGAGFIGSHLVPALSNRGHLVRVLDNLSTQIHGHLPDGLAWPERDSVEFVRGSVTNREELGTALADVEAVVHLAAETGTAQSMYEIARYNRINSQGTAILLDILANCRQRQVKRIILASSRSVYGEGAYVCSGCQRTDRIYPSSRAAEQLAAHRWDFVCESCGSSLTPVVTREDDAVAPASIYAATKLAQEELLRIACGALGIGYATLRLQNVYGEGQSLNNPYTGILSIFSTRIRVGRSLPVFEDGLETRDFVHVEDVARAFVAALESEGPANTVVNVGSGEGTTILDIARRLGAAFGTSPEIVVTGQYRLGDIRHNRADTARLCALFDCKPGVDLDSGLKRFASWVVEQPVLDDRLDRANAELTARRLMG